MAQLYAGAFLAGILRVFFGPLAAFLWVACSPVRVLREAPAESATPSSGL